MPALRTRRTDLIPLIKLEIRVRVTPIDLRQELGEDLYSLIEWVPSHNGRVMEADARSGP